MRISYSLPLLTGTGFRGAQIRLDERQPVANSNWIIFYVYKLYQNIKYRLSAEFIHVQYENNKTNHYRTLFRKFAVSLVMYFRFVARPERVRNINRPTIIKQ